MDDDSSHMNVERHEERHVETCRCLLLLLMLEQFSKCACSFAADLCQCCCANAPITVLLHFQQSLVQHGIAGGKPLQSLYGCPWNGNIRSEQHTGSVASSSTEVLFG